MRNLKNITKNYILISMEGISYWADAAGQIPFVLLIGDNIQSDIINGEPMAKLLANLIKSKLPTQIKQSNESIKNFVRNCIEIQVVNTITKDIK